MTMTKGQSFFYIEGSFESIYRSTEDTQSQYATLLREIWADL